MEEWKALMEKLDEKTRNWYFAGEKDSGEDSEDTFNCL